MKKEMNYVVQSRIQNAENVRLHLNRQNKLDIQRKIKKIILNKEYYLLLPVTELMQEYICYSDPSPEFYHVNQSVYSLLKGKLTPIELTYIPASWHIIGNIIIVNIKKQLDHKELLIAKALLELYPKCTSVVKDMGIKGELRLPQRKLIIGNITETIHKENGCYFKLDVTKVMFSKGNQHEKKRLIQEIDGEVIVDMFAGIGYFSIPLAVHSSAKKIMAIELNPISHKYLLENIYLNHVENIIEPILGNCKFFAPTCIADRVIMGYVGNTHEFLLAGIQALKKSGGIIHYHETTPEYLINRRPIDRIKKAVTELGKKVDILSIRRIKKYSPGVWHIVVDAKIYDEK